MSCFSWILHSRPVLANQRGWVAFQLGLFFLPSSAVLSGLFLAFALGFGSFKRTESFIKDAWNWPFLIAAILMVLSCIGAYSGWLAWIGLWNWLPFFWAFWAFQPYLLDGNSRMRSALLFLAGTVPVVLTGFGQLWWGWEGPWELFGGLVIWFVAPGGEPLGRLSGLFDYANIAGAWLALVWPFSLAALMQFGLSRYQRLVVFLLAISIVAAITLTDSRNAWGGLMLAIPFVVGPISWPWLLPCLGVFLLPVVLAALPGVPFLLQQWAREFVPESIWSRLNDMRYTQRALASTRLSQWDIAIQLCLERPWLGWGAAAFSVLYPIRTGQWHGHAHNLPLELAVSYGLLVSSLVVCCVLSLLITALYRGMLKGGMSRNYAANILLFDRAWWAASFIVVVMHATDMPFFDSRLNLAGWILLAGLRCSIRQEQANHHFSLKPNGDVLVSGLSPKDP